MAASAPPAITTARQETRCDASTVAVGMVSPPSPTMSAMPFMRRPRSPGKSSDDKAFDAVLVLADARPRRSNADAATAAPAAVASSGRHNATSDKESTSAARCPTLSTSGPESRLPISSPANNVEMRRPRSASVSPNCSTVSD